MPGRMVASAKSWLCHAGVDRQAAILPWGAGEGGKLSPVDASARILGHVARAWEHVMGVALAACEIVVTVPASFDEVARELTVAAAAKAGLAQVTLVEEPQAVFYAWIDANSGARRRQALHPGERVLVCDVGGGTTDFTLIDVAADDFERRAVGDHLLLGGDNVDIALARRLEARLGKKMDAVQWHGLVHACRMAEARHLLGERPLSRRRSVPITVAVRAAPAHRRASCAGEPRARRAGNEVVLDGFFPKVEVRAARPAKARARACIRVRVALRRRRGDHASSGWLFRPAPRARRRDPLQRRRDEAGASPHPRRRAGRRVARGCAAPREPMPRPDPSRSRTATRCVLRAWSGAGWARASGGGAARAYYVSAAAGSVVFASCRAAPRRAPSASCPRTSSRPRTDRPASVSTRRACADDKAGEVVALAGAAERDDAEIVELPPLVTVLRAPGQKEARVRIRARADLEIGTLELWCVGEDRPRRLRRANPAEAALTSMRAGG